MALLPKKFQTPKKKPVWRLAFSLKNLLPMEDGCFYPNCNYYYDY